MTLVSRLLVPGCAGAEVTDCGQDIALRPAEATHVAAAGARRRRDFTLGRHCAHEALAGIGCGETAIPVGASGAPVWPAGIVGSITHTAGYAAAMVAPCDRFQALGLDAERIGGVTEALMPRLFGMEEREWLMAQGAPRRAAVLTVFFSAKEAFHKALGKGRLSFKDIRVEMQGDTGFVAHHDGRTVQGSVAIQGGLVLTAVIVP